MSRGPDCQVFGLTQPYGTRQLSGVDVWSEDTLVRWKWSKPEIYQGTGGGGSRRLVDAEYRPFSWRRILDEVPGLRKSDNYLVASIRSFVDAVRSRKRTVDLGP